jgi:hypothetical protein
MALKRAFSQLGLAIPGDDFEAAIGQLVSELHPSWPEAHRQSLVNEFASRAEQIASYLFDTQNR